MKILRAVDGALAFWGVAVLACFLFLSPAFAPTAPGALASLALGALAAYAVAFTGWRILRALGPRLGSPAPLEAQVIEIALGLVPAIASTFAAAALGLLHPSLVWILLGASLLGPHASYLRDLRLRFAPPAPPIGDESPRRARSAFLLTLLALVAVLTLASSLAPTTAQDALVYHLAVPQHHVRAGGFECIEGNFFAQFPQNIEMLFTMALLLGRPELAQVAHWLLAVSTTLAAAALALRLARRGSAVLAAVAFATIPTAGLIGSWAYVDLGVTFFILASLLALLIWQAEGRTAWLFVAAALAGLAAGSKYTAGFQGIFVAAAAYWARPGTRPARRRLAEACLSALICGAVASPWWVKNIIECGNPLFPFAFGIFGGRGWDAERAETLRLALAEWGGERGFLSVALLPWTLTMKSEFFSEARFDGVLGCAFLITLPIILRGVFRSPAHRMVGLFMAANACVWILTTWQMRFLLPACGAAAAILGAEAPGVLWGSFPRKALRLAMNGALALNVLVVGIYTACHNPFPVVLGIESRDRYMERELPGGDWGVFRYIEERLAPDSRIFFASLGNPGFLSKRDYRSDAFFENHTLNRILKDARDAGDVALALRRGGFTHFLFNWYHVFDPKGKKSDVSVEDQAKLAEYLNAHARLLVRASDTLLYALEPTVEDDTHSGPR